MLCKIRKPWDRLAENEATPESIYLNRRQFAKKLGLGTLLMGAGLTARGMGQSYGPYGGVPAEWLKQWADLFPAARNTRFTVERSITDERIVAGYNNFYEFSLMKQRVKDRVGEFVVHPWEVEISGEVERKGKYDLDGLVRMGTLEERLYRFRCVEAWSANVPWTGFPLRQLIENVNPSSDAKYVRFVTALRAGQMPGVREEPNYPWPYYEALTMEEAMNELALLTFGMYGHPLSKQNGAPVRMILPWKYGFKSIKSIVKIEFHKRRPRTFWSDASREYGFFANTHPRYDHPRWTQATETFLNTGEKIPTKPYNGYGEYVAHLYDEDDRKYFY